MNLNIIGNLLSWWRPGVEPLTFPLPAGRSKPAELALTIKKSHFSMRLLKALEILSDEGGEQESRTPDLLHAMPYLLNILLITFQ
jgi:hypothetical protein